MLLSFPTSERNPSVFVRSTCIASIRLTPTVVQRVDSATAGSSPGSSAVTRTGPRTRR